MTKLLAALAATSLFVSASASAQTTLRMFGQHRAAIGYKFVTVHSSVPVNCLNRIYDGLQRYNNELGVNFKLYYNGTSPDYPNVGMGQPWRESSIDILFSDIAGYTYKGTTLTNSHLGFADHAYSSTDRTHILDAQVYENANYYYFGTGTPGGGNFDCDRTDGLTGVDYRSHVMHEIGHAVGLTHMPDETQYQGCLMFPRYISPGLVRDWCSVEVYTLQRAYNGASPSGIVYQQPLVAADTM